MCASLQISHRVITLPIGSEFPTVFTLALIDNHTWVHTRHY